MLEEHSTNGISSTAKRARLAQRLDSAGWGLFFVWVGIALLMDLGWGIGLMGVAAITLGEQVARRHYGLPLEGFWVVVGLGLLAGGLWEVFEVEVSLVPILLIVAGTALLLSPSHGRYRRLCRCRPRAK